MNQRIQFERGDRVRCIDAAGAKVSGLIEGRDYTVADHDGGAIGARVLAVLDEGDERIWPCSDRRFDLVRGHEDKDEEYEHKFEPGDRLRCTDASQTPYLAEGRLYTMRGVDGGVGSRLLRVTDEHGREIHYVYEWRFEKAPTASEAADEFAADLAALVEDYRNRLDVPARLVADKLEDAHADAETDAGYEDEEPDDDETD